MMSTIVRDSTINRSPLSGLISLRARMMVGAGAIPFAHNAGQISFLIAFLLFALVSTTVRAQTLSLPWDGAYQPGRYMPLRIDADVAGTIQIRGEETLGIDFDAAGKTSVVVPWMCWRSSGGEITVEVNGKPTRLSLRPLAPGELLPSSPSFAFTEPTPIAGPVSAMYSREAYVPLTAWSPGRPEQARRGIVIAAVAITLVIAAVWIGLGRSRWTPAVIVVVALVGMAMVSLRPELSRRDARLRVAVAAGEQRDEWVYRASRDNQTVLEPWTDVSWFVPQSPRHLQRIGPVLKVDSAGRPTEFELTLTPGIAAGVLHRHVGTEPAVNIDDTLASPEFARRLYGGAVKMDDDWMRLAPVATNPAPAATAPAFKTP
jgi:hypothetical protein